MIPKSWKRGFDVAKASSVYSIAPKQRVKVGAALYNGPRLLSIGFNTYGTTHPGTAKEKDFDRNIHAEHRALIKRQYYVNDNSTMYVYRGNANGEAVCSRPCSHCQILMKDAGVSRVRFIDETNTPREMLL